MGNLEDLRGSLPEFIRRPTCKIKAGKWIVWVLDSVVVQARCDKALIVLPGIVYDFGGRIDA